MNENESIPGANGLQVVHRDIYDDGRDIVRILAFGYHSGGRVYFAKQVVSKIPRGCGHGYPQT